MTTLMWRVRQGQSMLSEEHVKLLHDVDANCRACALGHADACTQMHA